MQRVGAVRQHLTYLLCLQAPVPKPVPASSHRLMSTSPVSPVLASFDIDSLVAQMHLCLDTTTFFEPDAVKRGTSRPGPWSRLLEPAY